MEDSPELFLFQEKTASTQPPVSGSLTSDSEIEKMAHLLATGDIVEEEISFNERIAAALILQNTISSLVKHASEESYSESQRDKASREKSEEEEEEEKIAAFVQNAKANGHSDEEVSEFLEKEAKLKLSPQVMKRLGLVGLGAGATVAGHEVGKKKGQKETAEKAVKAMPTVFRAGMLRGYKMGLERGTPKDG
jgi:hypothetical protein